MPITPPAASAERQARTARRGLTLLESTRHAVVHELLVASIGTLAEITLVLSAVSLAARWQPVAPVEIADRPFFLAPKEQRAAKPKQEHIQYVGLAGAPVPVVVTREAKAIPLAVESETKALANPAALNSPAQTAVEPQRPLSEIEVDSLVERDPSSEGPAYPPALLAKQIEGEVHVMFVVDTTGRVDPATLSVISSTDPAFTAAVRTSLPRMKFRPAMLHGRVVPQLVEQAFAFRITKPQALGGNPV